MPLFVCSFLRPLKKCLKAGVSLKKLSLKSVLSFSAAVTMILSGCGASSSQEPQAQEAEIIETKETIEHPELETDKIVSIMVELSAYSMEVFTDYISNIGKTYTEQEFLDRAQEEIAATYNYLDGLEDLPDQETSNEYVTSAKDVINCVGASWIKARDYLENLKDEDLQTLESIVGGYPLVALKFSASRQIYLSNAGYTEEEINEIVGSYGFNMIGEPAE